MARLAAGMVYLLMADALLASPAYLATKWDGAWVNLLAYAPGHLVGLGSAIAVWRSRKLRQAIGNGLDRVSAVLSRLSGRVLFIAGMTALRLAWVLLVPTEPTSDNAVYHGLAVRLIETGVFDTEKHRAYWPPGYPGFLAGLYLVFGASVLVGKLGNVVLAGLADWLVYRLVFKHAGGTAAAAALVLTAAWPGRNLHVDVLSYDELTIVLLLLGLTLLPPGRGCGTPRDSVPIVGPTRSAAPGRFVAAWLRGMVARRPALRWIAGGLALGLGALVRPTLVLLPAAILVWQLAANGAWRPALSRTAAFTAGMLAAIAPWTVRNYLVLDRLVPITTSAGGNFYNSWAPEGDGGFCKSAWQRLQAATGGDERLLSSTGLAWGLEGIRHNPGLAVGRVFQKQALYLGSDNWLLPVESYIAAFGGRAELGKGLKFAMHSLSNAWYLLALLLPLVGAGRLGRGLARGPLAMLGLSIFVLGLITHTIFEAQARYHLIYLPAWSIMLAVVLPITLPERAAEKPCRSVLSFSGSPTQAAWPQPCSTR